MRCRACGHRLNEESDLWLLPDGTENDLCFTCIESLKEDEDYIDIEGFLYEVRQYMYESGYDIIPTEHSGFERDLRDIEY